MNWECNRFYNYGLNMVMWWNLRGSGTFSIGAMYFGQFCFMFSHLRKFSSLTWYSFSTLEGTDFSLLQKESLLLPLHKCLSHSESFASATKTNSFTELKDISVHSIRCLTLAKVCVLHALYKKIPTVVFSHKLHILSFTPLVMHKE